MKYPDQVSYDLSRYQEQQDRDEEYFKMNRDQMIEETIYKSECDFCQDDLLTAINDASVINLTDLSLALRGGDGPECLFALKNIRDEWIKKQAEDLVDNS